MRLGYLAPLTVETIVGARKLGYDALEANAGWLTGTGLHEIERSLPSLREALQREHITISAIAIYGDALHASVNDVVAYYGRAIKVATELGCPVVAGMTGRDITTTLADNIRRYVERFEPVARLAGDSGVAVAFEPWPGEISGDGPLHWANLATTPELYDRLFDALPNSTLGIEYDASHLVWQGIDYLRVLRDYGSRIHHMHAKDIRVDLERLRRVGVLGADWWRFVIPGLGQIDWPQLLTTARDTGYAGNLTVEHEDRAYLGDRWTEGLMIGLKMLRPLVDELWPDQPASAQRPA